MMVGTSLATCRGCGGEVELMDLAAAAPVENGVVIAWRHGDCGAIGQLVVTRDQAIQIHRRIGGFPGLSDAEEALLEWRAILEKTDTVEPWE